MGKGMEEPDTEGVATHGGPESCVGDPRGRSEALTGVRAGRAMEPRNKQLRGADAVRKVEGNTACAVSARRTGAPRGRRNPSTYGIPMRENREIPHSPTRVIAGWAAQERPRPHA